MKFETSLSFISFVQPCVLPSSTSNTYVYFNNTHDNRRKYNILARSLLLYCSFYFYFSEHKMCASEVVKIRQSRMLFVNLECFIVAVESSRHAIVAMTEQPLVPDVLTEFKCIRRWKSRDANITSYCMKMVIHHEPGVSVVIVIFIVTLVIDPNDMKMAYNILILLHLRHAHKRINWRLHFLPFY